MNTRPWPADDWKGRAVLYSTVGRECLVKLRRGLADEGRGRGLAPKIIILLMIYRYHYAIRGDHCGVQREMGQDL